MCTYHFRGICKAVNGDVALMICALIGFESQPWQAWRKGGHLTEFEPHMLKDTLFGFESHTSDGRLNWI